MAVQSNVIRTWAWIDLVVTALMAVPPLAVIFIELLYALNSLMGGTATPPDFAGIHWLFVCVAGTLGVAWAVARISQPVRPLGIIDGLARLWVSALIVYYVLEREAPAALLLFLVTEIIGAIHQLWVLRRPQRHSAW